MLKKLWKNEEGQTLVMAALLLATLLGFAALVIDVGYFYMEKRQLQTAVDAAALAGAIVAHKESRNEEKVDLAVSEYLHHNLDSSVTGEVVTISSDDPVKVTVELTNEYPTFFAKIFGVNATDIHAMATAQVFDHIAESSKLAVFAEQILVTINGNKAQIEGDVYSLQPPNIDESKVTIDGEIQDGSDYPDEKPVLPDYSFIKNMLPHAITAGEFNTKYIENKELLSGIVYISGTDVTIGQGNGKSVLKGSGVIYTTGNLNIGTIPDPAYLSSILYYSEKNIVLSSADIQGILYAPNGNVTQNGNPEIHVQGRILAKNYVTLNGAKFTLGNYAHDEDWVKALNKMSKLIE